MHARLNMSAEARLHLLLQSSDGMSNINVLVTYLIYSVMLLWVHTSVMQTVLPQNEAL